jgi:hypothetical protein
MQWLTETKTLENTNVRQNRHEALVRPGPAAHGLSPPGAPRLG